MLWNVEESDEVKTSRALRRQAMNYAAGYLLDEGLAERAHRLKMLEAAARAYADTQPRTRRRKRA